MILTLEELANLSAESSFIKERLNGKTLFRADSENNKRFERWKKKTGGSGGEAVFLKRLKAEDISIARATEISARQVTWNNTYELPAWTANINEMLAILPADEEWLKKQLQFELDAYLQALKEQTRGNEKVYAEASQSAGCLLPFLYYAEQNLRQRLGNRKQLFTDKALADISEILLKGLIVLIHKIFPSQLRLYILRQESFGFLMNLQEEDSIRYASEFKNHLLAGGWKDIFMEFPVLPRLMTVVINNWLNNMTELASYLDDDLELLREKFNQHKYGEKVNRITGNISDAHNQGKGVLILEFENGAKLVYKPRDLGVDIAYNRLIEKINERGFVYQLHAPQVLTMGNHGWIEFIANKSLDDKEQARDYYRRAGALFGLVYVLGGNDFHGENMIAAGEHPVLVDLETILSCKMIQFNEDYENIKDVQNFVDLFQESVLGMGFLPIWIKASDEISVDIGALTGNIKSSIPNFNGEPIEVFDYQNELMEGFSALYEFFSENRETLTDDIRNIFAKAVLRIIIRPTQVYFKMLYHTLSPEFLKDGFLYSLEIERFAPAFLIKVEEDKVNKIWDIFLSERDALEERDIPIFHGYADALDIRGHDKILSEEYFADTALDRVIKKINALNHDDKARQLDFIKESLSIYQTGCHSEKKRLNCDLDLKDPDAAHRHDLLAEARSISRDIMEKSIYLGEKGFAWICYSHDLAGNKVSIGQTTYSLYDGVWGIALFIAALYRLTEEETIRSQALMLIQPFIEALYNKTYPLPVYRMRIGWGDGLGGIIKSLVMIGDYLRYDSLYDDALYLIDRITREQIKKAQDKTVYGGLAGIMTALLTCFERFQHQYSLELATLCGEQILKNQQYLDNIGLGCGNSGIICALARLYDVTHEPHLYDAIQEMARYNANLYNRRVCQKVPGSTCSGIAGLGLACLAMPLGSDNIQVDMNQVIEQILTYPMYYGDHLCCGNSGRVDFLVEASLRLNRPELLQEADRRLQWMINRQRESGHFHIEGSSSLAISNPSFFQGLSGIGYEMLRCTAPHMIGSVFY